jgi:hypothetical protein
MPLRFVEAVGALDRLREGDVQALILACVHVALGRDGNGL